MSNCFGVMLFLLRINQCSIISTCMPDNLTSGAFSFSSDVGVFIEARTVVGDMASGTTFPFFPLDPLAAAPPSLEPRCFFLGRTIWDSIHVRNFIPNIDATLTDSTSVTDRHYSGRSSQWIRDNALGFIPTSAASGFTDLWKKMGRHKFRMQICTA